MGNFSRDTHDITKNYVSVRLQQGVPLVDADWNELSDVTLREVRGATETGLGSGVAPGSSAWSITGGIAINNDFTINAGTICVNGRPVQLPASVRYSNQPLADPARAAAAGVSVPAPLTTPGSDRRDLVFLEIFEREVQSGEDTNLINPLIGVETSVRTKREWVVRVLQGSTTLPAAPMGHIRVPLAILNRPAGASTVLSQIVTDIRPRLAGAKGSRDYCFLPAFQRMWLGSDLPPWNLVAPFSLRLYAGKQAANNANGVLPLALPDRSTIQSVRVQGQTSGNIQFTLVRVELAWTNAGDYTLLLDQTVAAAAPNTVYNSNFAVPTTPERIELVNNSRYAYFLHASAVAGYEASISGISVRAQL